MIKDRINKKNKIKCRVCDSNTYNINHELVENKNIKVLKCANCELVQLSSTDHICSGFYESSEYFGKNLNSIINREKHWNFKRVKLISENYPTAEKKVCLDLGCGPGGFLDVGENIFKKLYGYDLSQRIREWNKSRNKLILDNLDKVDDINVITLFHVLEHIKNPLDFIYDIKRKFLNLETLIVEVPNNEEFLISEFNNKSYINNHYNSEHLNYFNSKTLTSLLKKALFKIEINTQYQRYQLGNTLGWLNYGKGGFQNQFPEFNNPVFHESYENILVSRKAADSLFVIASLN